MRINFFFKTDNKYIANTINVLVITFIAIFLYSLNTSSFPDFLKIFSISILTSISSLFLGSAFGFLFGIPNQVDTEMKDKFEHNNSLRQISDWLTKIIIGVSLIELKSIFSIFQRLVFFITELVSFESSFNVYISTIIIIFLIAGFFITYILTITEFFKVIVTNYRDILRIINSKNINPEPIGISNYINQKDIYFTDSEKSEIVSFVTDVKKGIAEISDSYMAKRLAKALFHLSEFSSSADVYKIAYELDGKDLESRYNEAFIRSKFLKQFKESNEILDDILKRDKSEKTAFYNLACNSNRELKEIIQSNIDDEIKKNQLIDDIKNNLKEAFILDDSLYTAALKDEELAGDGHFDVEDIYKNLQK